VKIKSVYIFNLSVEKLEKIGSVGGAPCVC